MTLSIDNRIIAEGEAAGRLVNSPFPVNVGRNAETHGQDTDVHICDARMDNVCIFDKALSAEEQTAENALLYLDFEEEIQGGKYFTYGIGARTYGTIWPDRTIQPEIWQMKKAHNQSSARLSTLTDKRWKSGTAALSWVRIITLPHGSFTKTAM